MRERLKAFLQTSPILKISQVKRGKIKGKQNKLCYQTFHNAATAQATTIWVSAQCIEVTNTLSMTL